MLKKLSCRGRTRAIGRDMRRLSVVPYGTRVSALEYTRILVRNVCSRSSFPAGQRAHTACGGTIDKSGWMAAELAGRSSVSAL